MNPKKDLLWSPCVTLKPSNKTAALRATTNIEALIIRTGFGGPFYYSYNKEPPKIVEVIIGPYSI